MIGIENDLSLAIWFYLVYVLVGLILALGSILLRMRFAKHKRKFLHPYGILIIFGYVVMITMFWFPLCLKFLSMKKGYAIPNGSLEQLYTIFWNSLPEEAKDEYDFEKFLEEYECEVI